MQQMLASATASPYQSGVPTPLNPLSPIDTPSHSRSHSPASVSLEMKASQGGSGSGSGSGSGAAASALALAQGASSAYKAAFPFGPPSATSRYGSRRGSLGIATGGQGSFSMEGSGGDRTPSALPPRRAHSHANREQESSTSGQSGIAYHVGGHSTMGLGLDACDDDSQTGNSRSETPPPSFFSSSASSSFAAAAASPTLGFDQLCFVGSLLNAGIGTSFETRKKDASGRVFHNCFMGKEALNCLRQQRLALALPLSPPAAHSRGSGSSGSVEQCTAILQQMLTEGFLSVAQSTEELDRIIAAKFAATTSPPPPSAAGTNSSRGASPKLGPLGSSNPLAVKLNLSAIGGAVASQPSPPPVQFKKEALYQLTPLWRTGNAAAGATSFTSASASSVTSPVGGGGGGSAGNSSRNSPVMFSPPPPQTWYANYAGFLGKKRENKGLGNSLALGLGVSAFQKRWFVCSQKEQAVLYYKEDPRTGGGVEDGGSAALSPTTGSSPFSSSSSNQPPPFPLGFIPFSEILLVDHLASSAAQMAAQAQAGSSSPFGSPVKKKGSVGSLTSLQSPGSPSQTPVDDKAGRLFDIIASFRVYHLQAESTLEAMKWAQAIRENVRDCALLRGAGMLGSHAQASLNAGAQGGYGTLKGSSSGNGGTVRTPRTPDHLKRFWSNSSTPSMAASAFPGQYLTQVLRDAAHTSRNGLWGQRIWPQRLSPLRRHFFELHFSVSSLDQPSYFDFLQADFDTDESIVRFAWECITRGMRTGTEAWGPRSFRTHMNAPATAATAAVDVGTKSHTGTATPTTVSSPLFAGAHGRSSVLLTRRDSCGKIFVDPSASLVLLARMQEAENNSGEGDEEDEYEQESREEESTTGSSTTFGDETRLGGGGGGPGSVAPSRKSSMTHGGAPGNLTLPRAPRHRRAISGSMLPDSLYRQVPPGYCGSGVMSPNGGHRREESFNLDALQARRVLNATRPFHRRFGSSLYPLPRSLRDDCALPSSAGGGGSGGPGRSRRPNKFHDLHYMLLNKYALYHASAYRAPANSSAAIEQTAQGHGPLNPPFLYRLLHPYQRMESWLHSDCFLNLLLNDAQLLNEVPLALPLVWLVLQWRNHDSDSGGGGGDGGKVFVDDACLKKNWMDPSVDGEDDGHVGDDGVSESEAASAAEKKEESARAGFRSVTGTRRHLRVNSFSTLVDPVSAMRGATAVGGAHSPMTAGSPMSPPHQLSSTSAPPVAVPHVPTVYGAHGQVVPASAMRGGGGNTRGHPITSPQPTPHPTLAQLHLGTSSGGPMGSPQSSSVLYEYDAPTSPPAYDPTPSPNAMEGAAASAGKRSPPVHIHLEHPLKPAMQKSAGGTPNVKGLHVHISPMAGGSFTPSPAAASAGIASTPPKLHRNPPSFDSPSPRPRKAGSSLSSNGSPPPPPPGGSPPRESNTVSFASPGSVKFAEPELLSASLEPDTGDLERDSSVSRGAAEEEGTTGTDTARTSDASNDGTTSARTRMMRGSASMPNTRRNSLVGIAEGGDTSLPAHKSTDSHSSSSGTCTPVGRAHQGSSGSDTAHTTPRHLPRTAPSLGSSKSTPGTPTLQLRPRTAAVFHAASPRMRSPNLLPGAGGGYATLRPHTAPSLQSAPPIPLGLSHWKVRSLVGCRHCFQSAREFSQILSERYGVDGAALEAARIRAMKKSATAAREAAGMGTKRNSVVIDPPPVPASELTISLANTLLSLLLTPLHSLPYMLSSGVASLDSLNVLGKTIVNPHIWPSIIACLQSRVVVPPAAAATSASSASGPKSPSIGAKSPTRCSTPAPLTPNPALFGRPPTPSGGGGGSSATAAPSWTPPPPAPYLAHHLLKDLNTLFIGSNVSANNRNCSLIFKFFAAVQRRERKDQEEMRAREEAERKMSERERERLEKRRLKQGQPGHKHLIGSWQQGLLELLRTHVPVTSTAPSARSAASTPDALATERLHSKVYQYALNLFGVFHFYKFQCIGTANSSASNISLSLGGGRSPRQDGGRAPVSGSTCADFERMFKESFWRSMHMDDGVLAARATMEAAMAKAAKVELASPSSTSTRSTLRAGANSAVYGLGLPPSCSPHSPLVAHTVARSMLTSMLQRLIFKVKSRSILLEGRWPALAFLVAMVKSFVFSIPLRQAQMSAGANGTASNATPGGNTLTPPSNTSSSSSSSSSSSDSALLGFDLDFPSGSETLHRSRPGALFEDMELLEKALELLRALRLYQEQPEADVTLSLSKQRELRGHVEAIAASSARGVRLGELHDPLSKLKLSTAHDELARLYALLPPQDQAALRFLQQQASFLKDSVCFLAIMQQQMARRGSQHPMEDKELTWLVSHFVSIDRREKVFCGSK